MTTRADIAAAASTVPDITVSETYRQVTKPGQGFVQYLRSDRDSSGLGYMDRWSVVVCLPQDIAAAEAYLEAHLDGLLDALSGPLVVLLAQPVTLAMDQGQIPALSIEGVTAH